MNVYQQKAIKEGKLRPTNIPAHRTDNDLVMMARRSWVITDDKKDKWKTVQDLPYLIQWSLLKERLKCNGNDFEP